MKTGCISSLPACLCGAGGNLLRGHLHGRLPQGRQGCLLHYRLLAQPLSAPAVMSTEVACQIMKGSIINDHTLICSMDNNGINVEVMKLVLMIILMTMSLGVGFGLGRLSAHRHSGSREPEGEPEVQGGASNTSAPLPTAVPAATPVASEDPVGPAVAVAPPAVALALQVPRLIFISPQGERFHSHGQCFGLRHARSVSQRTPCTLCWAVQ